MSDDADKLAAGCLADGAAEVDPSDKDQREYCIRQAIRAPQLARAKEPGHGS